MLSRRQSTVLCAGGAVFWCADAAWIRLVPAVVTGPLWSDIEFLLSIPLAWLCVRLCRSLAGLQPVQLVPGVTVLVIVAALAHAMALRWAPNLYGNDHTGRLGSAWLLWVYGLILVFALLPALKGQQTNLAPATP